MILTELYIAVKGKVIHCGKLIFIDTATFIHQLLAPVMDIWFIYNESYHGHKPQGGGCM